MERMTRGGSCVEEGDYLAWGDMEWILHGQAKIETTEKEKTCKGKPLVDLYYTPFPAGMDSCMHHCQNIGSKAPSVNTYEDWTKLQTFLKKKLYDKGLNTMEILRRKMCGRTFTQERQSSTWDPSQEPGPMVEKLKTVRYKSQKINGLMGSVKQSSTTTFALAVMWKGPTFTSEVFSQILIWIPFIFRGPTWMM